MRESGRHSQTSDRQDCALISSKEPGCGLEKAREGLGGRHEIPVKGARATKTTRGRASARTDRRGDRPVTSPQRRAKDGFTCLAYSCTSRKSDYIPEQTACRPWPNLAYLGYLGLPCQSRSSLSRPPPKAPAPKLPSSQHQLRSQQANLRPHLRPHMRPHCPTNLPH